MALWVLRIVFVAVAAGLGVWIVKGSNAPIRLPVDDHPVAVLLAVIGIAVGVIAIDVSVRRKRLDTISAVYFGLIVGLLLSYAVYLATTPLPIDRSVREALQLVTSTVRNAVAYATGKQRFYPGIGLHLQALYAAVAAGEEPPVSAAEGRDVVAWYDEILAQSGISAPPAALAG